MESNQPAPPPTPDLLGAFGKLREALAALRNLEHLLGSVQVGPKVLAHVMPELVQSSAGWRHEGVSLLAHCRAVLDRDGRLDVFARSFAEHLERIAEALGRADPLGARSRLSLEREVRRFVPTLAAYVDHLELLLEATVAKGVPLSLAELLHSRPEMASESPYVSLPVAGDAESAEVTLPARVLLRALGTLAAGVEPHVGLRIDTADGLCRITLAADVRSDVVAQLPTLASLPDGVEVLRCALRHNGVSLSADGRVLELPCRPS